MNSKLYRWIICFAGTLALFCTGGLIITGFNVYTPYLLSVEGLTGGELSIVLMLRNVFTFLTMFYVVRAIRHLDVRLTMTVSVVVAALAFFVFSLSMGFFSVAFGMALAGTAYGLGGMVTVSVLIKRWFEDNDGLALGICAAGTGLSAVLGSSLITRLVEDRSLRESFRLEGCFLLVVALVLFALVRNYPSKEKQQEVARARKEKISHQKGARVFKVEGRQKVLLILGVLLCGMSFNVSPFLAVLLREKSFDADTVALLISFMGLALVVVKCVYGEAADFFGKLLAGTIFHGMYILGTLLCTICIPGSRAISYVAMFFLGMGFPMLSVGLSELAAATAYEEYYADGVRQFQIIYMLGSIFFGVVPGFLADQLGSYQPVYMILTLLAVGSALLQQTVLLSCEGKKDR